MKRKPITEGEVWHNMNEALERMSLEHQKVLYVKKFQKNGY